MKALGEWVTLNGEDAGIALDICPHHIIEESYSGTDPAPPGSRYYSIGIAIENVGTLPYRGTLAYGTVLVDAAGYQYEASSIVDFLELGDVKVSPGDFRRGFVGFELPATAQPVEVLVTLDHGYGPDTGHWDLTRETPAALGGMKVGTHAAQVGDAQIVDGDDGRLGIVVEDGVDLTDTVEEYMLDLPTNRVVGVGLHIQNVGRQRYSDNPTYGAVLVAESGMQVEATSSLGDTGPLLGNLMLPPDASRKGFVVFEINESFRPALFQLSLDSGTAETYAEWDVRQLFTDLPEPDWKDEDEDAPDLDGPDQQLDLSSAAVELEPVDVNLAEEGELAALPGVGVILAKRAVSERSVRGGFSTVEEFIAVLELKPHVAVRVLERITVTAGAAPPAPRIQGRVVDY